MPKAIIRDHTFAISTLLDAILSRSFIVAETMFCANSASVEDMGVAPPAARTLRLVLAESSLDK